MTDHSIPAPPRKLRSRVNRYLGRSRSDIALIDKYPKLYSLNNVQPQPPQSPPHLITVIHAASSAHPSDWTGTFTSCSRHCHNPSQVEYLLVVDHHDRDNLGVFHGMLGRGSSRPLKSVFGSFRIVLNQGSSTLQDRWQAGLRHSHPQSLKIAVSSVQSPAWPILVKGWDTQLLKDLAGMDHVLELKDFPDSGQFAKVEHIDRESFVMKERIKPNV